MNKGEGTMGQLMTNDALYKRLDAVTTNLELLTAKLNKGEGTMGQLMNDKQLYENMNRTVTEIAAAAGRHPEGSEEVPERENEHLLRLRTRGLRAASSGRRCRE